MHYLSFVIHPYYVLSTVVKIYKKKRDSLIDIIAESNCPLRVSTNPKITFKTLRLFAFIYFFERSRLELTL